MNCCWSVLSTSRSTSRSAAAPPRSVTFHRSPTLSRNSKATRTELQGAIRSLEIAGEEQKAVNEEALSINEEYQSTNEELLTSKEELQSLNEELAALNSQLRESLERQRTTSNDLQNVLYSTGVATIFLDSDLNIRFFTPATKSLFGVIPSDVGRPLGDLTSLAADGALLTDAKTVLQSLEPIEREIEARSGAWYIRRILPYRTQNSAVEGVVITFADITDRRRTADELGEAKRQADVANAVKSRFLAAASHDLRQPLQTLALVQGLLAKTVDGEKAQNLVARLDETLGAMSGMLNTLLDINQIEAGTVHAEVVEFPINDLLERLRDEFAYHAQAKRLVLRVVPCSLVIRSDPRLLEQMIRNLLSNAMKYTRRGKVLLGCRRREGVLSIEVWDTGIGIPEAELQAIFEEYHQIDNPARARSLGLGLGLSIVRRLGKLLGHRVHVRSRPGKGSVFAIDVMLAQSGAAPQLQHSAEVTADTPVADGRRTGAILVVDDDPDVCELLELVLKAEGHQVATAPDGIRALELSARGVLQPDLVLADYNLPNGMNGIEIIAKLREQLGRQIPAIMLTGDISTGALDAISRQDCVQLNKPVKLPVLSRMIQVLLRRSQSAARVHVRHSAQTAGGERPPVIFVVDDDSNLREADPRRAGGRRPERRGLCDLRGIPRSVSSRPGSMPGDRCLSAGNERSRIAAATEGCGPSTAGHHDHRQQRRADSGSGHEGRRFGLHREAGRPRRTARRGRTCSDAVAGFKQAVRVAGNRGRPPFQTDAATAPDHGAGAFRPPQQEHRRGSAHQPAHRRESSQLDHDEDRLEISPGVGAIGDGR